MKNIKSFLLRKKMHLVLYVKAKKNSFDISAMKLIVLMKRESLNISIL